MLLLAVITSIPPVNGMLSRGCRLKPSSWLMTPTSTQSDGRVLQSGSGMFTRSPVSCSESATVNQSLGNGSCSGTDGVDRSKMTRTPVPCVAAARSELLLVCAAHVLTANRITKKRTLLRMSVASLDICLYLFSRAVELKSCVFHHFVQVNSAGVGSRNPALSIARTRNVWLRGETEEVAGLAHAAKSAPSSEHSKPAMLLLSMPVKRNVIELPRMAPPSATARPVLSVAERIAVSGTASTVTANMAGVASTNPEVSTARTANS